MLKGPGCTSRSGKAQAMAEALQSNATEMCQHTTGSKATLRAVLVIPHERLCMEVPNTVTLPRFSWQWGRRWNPPSGNYPHPQGRANLPRHEGRDMSWRSHRAHAEGRGQSRESSASHNHLPRSNGAPVAQAGQPWFMHLLHLEGKVLGVADRSP